MPAEPSLFASTVFDRYQTRLGIKGFGECRLADRDLGARVRELELQEVGRSERVDEQWHEPRAYGTKQRGRIGGGVVEEEQHTVAAPKPQRQCQHRLNFGPKPTV